eukprot:6132229-Prymnesium_polylepis.1
MNEQRGPRGLAPPAGWLDWLQELRMESLRPGGATKLPRVVSPGAFVAAAATNPASADGSTPP